MGVAGAGKSLIGSMLARALGVEFVEGDDFHSEENRRKMASGVPLDDDDRRGWLRGLAAHLEQARRAGVGLVVSCSALKRAYRDVLRSGAPNVRFVYLKGPRPLLAQRLAHRQGHFMPPALLESQLATLEEPGPDEEAWVVDVGTPPADIVADLVARAAGTPA
jgi:carbohydrate kinase (thermoresistant glucokinase family)